MFRDSLIETNKLANRGLRSPHIILNIRKTIMSEVELEFGSLMNTHLEEGFITEGLSDEPEEYRGLIGTARALVMGGYFTRLELETWSLCLIGHGKDLHIQAVVAPGEFGLVLERLAGYGRSNGFNRITLFPQYAYCTRAFSKHGFTTYTENGSMEKLL